MALAGFGAYPGNYPVAGQICAGGKLDSELYNLLFLPIRQPREVFGLAGKIRMYRKEFIDCRLQKTETPFAVFEYVLSRDQALLSPAINSFG